ncbi:uncharacterized protein LOC135167121 [Diachasmimorpha longicaudata]|uniref:uncharacterized protein LOC135167121 n=1 Tax=Diachasmimorpha longicaudata TaxID=58733 RepID=UPI0030B8A14F
MVQQNILKLKIVKWLDAYYLVPINVQFRKYLRFYFDGNLYEFNCLPFGLNTAPYLFTKIMKPVVGYLRNLGFLSVVYLDDILLIADSKLACLKNINFTVELLNELGFIINEEKSVRIPSQSCLFLGFILNSQKMSLELPLEKRKKIIKEIAHYKKLGKCKIREFAHFIGCLVSCCPAIPYGYAHIKNFERLKYLALLKSGGKFDEVMELKVQLQDDFQWWETNISWRIANIAVKKYSLTIFSDASGTGWGAVCNGKTAHGFWSETEIKFHINYLELLAAFLGLKYFAEKFKDCNILLRVDNTTAISYINRMGGVRFTKLSNLSRSIWEWCEQRGLTIFASYISSKDNSEADFESRRLKSDTEFELSKSAFNKIVETFGKPDIDLFASKNNKKCKNYIAWKPDPNSVAVDAFTIGWEKMFFYAFPPFILIPKVLQKIKSEGSRGIVKITFMEESYPGGRQVIREAFKKRGIPEDSLNISLSSLSDSSIKQYDHALRKWWNFGVSNKLSVYNADTSTILKFLTSEFERGASYGTLNTIRSAIALILGPDIGQNEIIKRFFKGLSKLRPSQPKYESTWDPKIVLDYFKDFSNEDLPLDVLSKKLVTLLALVTGQRMQTLALIDVRNIRIKNELVEIKIDSRIKTSKPGTKQPVLILPFFKENQNICPAKTLQKYLNISKDIRNKSHALFISFKKPYHKVSTQTLSRWVKDTLQECGVDTEIFSAHSTRHASTSSAKKLGVGIDLIKKCAGWTENSSVFAKFYNRPIIQDPSLFAKTILRVKFYHNCMKRLFRKDESLPIPLVLWTPILIFGYGCTLKIMSLGRQAPMQGTHRWGVDTFLFLAINLWCLGRYKEYYVVHLFGRGASYNYDRTSLTGIFVEMNLFYIFKD